DLPDRAGKTRACLTAGPNQPEHKKTDTPPCIGIIEIPIHEHSLAAVLASDAAQYCEGSTH
ncbi:hypothetical protein, partial [Pseudomonas amygdali]|uniref:hypothetical protein n=1 Tax=Pseudomonas amygdali TaxID=47877 RepID=UPI001F3DD51D